ncbi:hypothetical protein FRC12_001287 [Ceratobasidium sp. 428]|nr:hypothetical protein FRC12_001287 [Ceratobasidium sp. 428]
MLVGAGLCPSTGGKGGRAYGWGGCTPPGAAADAARFLDFLLTPRPPPFVVLTTPAIDALLEGGLDPPDPREKNPRKAWTGAEFVTVLLRERDRSGRGWV